MHTTEAARIPSSFIGRAVLILLRPLYDMRHFLRADRMKHTGLPVFDFIDQWRGLRGVFLVHKANFMDDVSA